MSSTLQFPPMPVLKDFPGHEYGYNEERFTLALNAWERVCKEIVESTRPRAWCDDGCSYKCLKTKCQGV